jgi:hypothetical protein
VSGLASPDQRQSFPKEATYSVVSECEVGGRTRCICQVGKVHALPVVKAVDKSIMEE